MPLLENVLKEVLRLHPPLIILMRQVSHDMKFKDYTIKQGDMVWACPPVTHRMSKLFSNPNAFDPDRFSPQRREDKNLMAYQPFGGGKHKCSGNAFAMFQIKAIFAILLRRYEFELVDTPDKYVDNYSEMIVQPQSPCRIRYKRRDPATFSSRFGSSEQANAQQCPVDHAAIKSSEQTKQQPRHKQLVVDMGLCQGHAVCMGEAPQYCQVDENNQLTIIKSVIDETDMAAVQNAVKFCPNQALRIAVCESEPA
jgi:sterol 14-demethylase